jgi:multicomponent Na+:H+ antiporter subunit A
MVGFLLAHALYKAALFFCAGTVIHATGLTKLRLMGGLRRLLPVTALASVLASLSMAGLPPFLGFVTKEFLFEAQIRSSWDAIPMAVAVLVNAVIVGVAGVVTLRPFFMNKGRVQEVRHREVPGLLVGPVLLALLGLVISVEPDWVSRAVLAPAVAAAYGQPVDVTVKQWHGVTPMLLLSGTVVGIGTLLFVFWVPIHQRLRALSRIDRYNTEEAYDALLRWIRTTGESVASRVQGGDLRNHLQIIFGAVAVFVIWGLVAMRSELRLPSHVGVIRAGPAALALVGLVGGLAAARARSLLAAMVATGLAGLVAALTFLMNGAPDLALTQFAVESLVVVLLTAALLTLPVGAAPTRSLRARRVDATLAAGLATLLFAALLDMSAAPQRTEVSQFFGTRSYLEAFGRNVVNVILVDFRGFDTLGETSVIALSALIAWSLLGPRARERQPSGGARRSVFVLAFAAPFFFWLLAALSVVVLLRGHNEIGGGFVGGLTAALAFAIIALTDGLGRARAKLRWHPLTLVGTGLVLAVASGLPGLVVYGDYLRHLWLEANLLGVQLKQGTTLLFDLGVYLAVLGTVLAFLFGFSRPVKS